MIDELLVIENLRRNRLNELRAKREKLEKEIDLTLGLLNETKRDLYAAGFKGNIMRDEFGNRRDVLPEIEGAE